jgi:purine-cytosine permease-like protein
MITIFGIRVFNFYERYAFLPQLIVLSILYGLAAKNFDTTTVSLGDATTIIGSRLSFFSLCLSAAITYAGVGPDYYVYYDPKSPSTKLFLLTLFGLTSSFSFGLILGIGLASGIASNAAYSSAYEVSQGALIVAGFEPVGTFGHFCSVVVALGIIANLIPTTYSTGIDVQLLARVASRVPRWIWNTVGAVIFTVCALAGREHLSEIFTNFLSLMGYWTAFWIAIILEEHLIFRRSRGWNWESWNDKSKLPLGCAALVAFLVGWVGAILGMAQVWFIGPIAKLVGEHGADMGSYLGFCWALLVYPPLRWLELRYTGR